MQIFLKKLIVVVIILLIYEMNVFGKKIDQEAINYVKNNGYEIAENTKEKIIDEILIVTNEPIGDDDALYPDWLNIFHIVTKKKFIRGELLFKSGDVIDTRLIEETIRNLMALSIFRVVEIIFINDNKKGFVDIIVYTRDIWSWGWAGSIVGGGGDNVFTFYMFNNNFLGQYLYIGGGFSYGNATWLLTEKYSDTRIFNSKIEVSEQVNFYLNHDGTYEGEAVYLSCDLPLRSRLSEFGFETTLQYKNNIERKFEGTQLKRYLVFFEEDVVYPVKEQYRQTEFLLSGGLLHSFGYKVKYNFGYGLGYFRNKYGVIDKLPDVVYEKFRRDFIPYDDYGPYVYTKYTQHNYKYKRIKNFYTYRIYEQVPFGYHWYTRFDYSDINFGSKFSYFVYYTQITYQDLISDENIYSLSASTQSKIKENRMENNLYQFSIVNYFDRLLAGRFAYLLRFGFFANPDKRETIYLGGDNYLRGYKSNLFTGNKYINTSLEYRFDPIEILGLYWGSVIFYDAGNSFDKPEIDSLKTIGKIKFHSSAGFGIRLLYPQAQDKIFRIDFGVPFEKQYASFNNLTSILEKFSFNFEHTF